VSLRIIDGDGHVFEDHSAIAAKLPSLYQERINNTPAWHDLFPPLDHLHQMPVDRRGMGRGNVALPEWKTFLEDIGLNDAVLYPTFALSYGMIRDRAWDRLIACAYNEWLAETYGNGDKRLHGMAILPMQDPDAAAAELVRGVKELGLLGAMLPAHGLPNHLGSPMYDPVYAAANEVGACLSVHGGVHSGYGLDDMDVYAVVHGLGHPFGQLISFGGIVLNGYFDKYPKLKVAFLEGGVAWVLMALERLTESYETHLPYEGSGAVVLPPGTRIRQYLMDLFKSHGSTSGLTATNCSCPKLSRSSARTRSSTLQTSRTKSPRSRARKNWRSSRKTTR
jgi:predicted TIM-barrel fold metal-dependent hydrolase